MNEPYVPSFTLMPPILALVEQVGETLESDQVDDQVSDQVDALLAVMPEAPQRALELMEKLSLSHRPTFRKNYLHPALSAGLIEMTHPDAPRAKNQKYRLTPKGRQWKNK